MVLPAMLKLRRFKAVTAMISMIMPMMRQRTPVAAPRFVVSVAVSSEEDDVRPVLLKGFPRSSGRISAIQKRPPLR